MILNSEQKLKKCVISYRININRKKKSLEKLVQTKFVFLHSSTSKAQTNEIQNDIENQKVRGSAIYFPLFFPFKSHTLNNIRPFHELLMWICSKNVAFV